MRADQEDRIRQNLHRSVHSFSKFLLSPHFRALQGEETSWSRGPPRVLAPVEGGPARGVSTPGACGVCVAGGCLSDIPAKPQVHMLWALWRDSTDGCEELLPGPLSFPFVGHTHGGIQGHITSTTA